MLDESRIPHPQKLTVKERLERFLYLSGDDWVLHKYVKGRRLFYTGAVNSQLFSSVRRRLSSSSRSGHCLLSSAMRFSFSRI